MTIAALCIREAVLEKLGMDSSLSSLLNGIYDEVVENTALPFLVLYDEIEQAADVYGRMGRECVLMLHVWSEYDGWEQCEAILNRVDELLHHQNLPALEGFSLVSVERDFAIGFRDSDGLSRHNVLRYRVLVEEEADD